MADKDQVPPSLSKLEGDQDELVCGIEKRKFFAHTRKKALVIAVSDYSELREQGKEWQKYEDLNETMNDAKHIIYGLKQLGCVDDDIIYLKDPSWDEIHLVVIDLAGDIQRSVADNEKTMVFMYYAGHAMQDRNVQLQLNQDKLYPMEQMLKTLAKAEGAYVVALYDCCRERIIDNKQSESIEEDIKSRITLTQTKNYIATYACEVTEGIPAKSTIAKAYMKYIKSMTKKTDGYLALPGPLSFFAGTDGKCEHNKDKPAQPILLYWDSNRVQRSKLIRKTVKIGGNEEVDEDEDD